MLPFFFVPLALAFGLAAHDAPATPAARAAADSGAVRDSSKAVVIEFDNQAWDMATVYAVPRFGMAVRLGEVMPGATAHLIVPRSVVSGLTTVDIVAVPFARNIALRSGPVSITPGDALSVSLPPAENNLSVLPAR